MCLTTQTEGKRSGAGILMISPPFSWVITCSRNTYCTAHIHSCIYTRAQMYGHCVREVTEDMGSHVRTHTCTCISV